MTKLSLILLSIFIVSCLGQYDDDYYSDDYEENPLENMPFYLIDEPDLDLCNQKPIIERLGLDENTAYSEKLLGPIKGDPVTQTCTERYEQKYEVNT